MKTLYQFLEAVEVVCRLVPVSGGHGSDDYESDDGDAYTVEASVGGYKVGSLDINVTDDTVHVRWVEVEKEFQRRGVASRMIQEAMRLFPNRDLDTNGFTDSGERFWSSLNK